VIRHEKQNQTCNKFTLHLPPCTELDSRWIKVLTGKAKVKRKQRRESLSLMGRNVLNKTLNAQTRRPQMDTSHCIRGRDIFV
jgi:hypothetical protein